jgi:regulator of cell morphogenesis and NO signaling
LTHACQEAGLSADAIVNEIESEGLNLDVSPRWDERPLAELVSHIVGFYHRRLREELPQLVEMADKVERVHHDKPERPVGLRDHMAEVHAAVLEHLAKEEVGGARSAEARRNCGPCGRRSSAAMRRERSCRCSPLHPWRSG